MCGIVSLPHASLHLTLGLDNAAGCTGPSKRCGFQRGDYHRKENGEWAEAASDSDTGRQRMHGSEISPCLARVAPSRFTQSEISVEEGVRECLVNTILIFKTDGLGAAEALANFFFLPQSS